jgi:hypothetical protein
MKRRTQIKSVARPKSDDLEDLIEQITVDAYGDAEQLWAFRQAFEDDFSVPCAATIAGTPGTVVKFDFDGNERRGLTAKCRLQDGSQQTISAADVQLPAGDPGERYLAAYRKWMGLPPHPEPKPAAPSRKRNGAVSPARNQGGAVDLVVLSVQKLAVRCRHLGSEERITLRAKRFWDLAPGEIVSVQPNKQWTYARNPYLSGEIESRRIDAGALGLRPLGLENCGMWDPGGGVLGRRGRADRGMGEADHRSRPAAAIRNAAGTAGRGPR